MEKAVALGNFDGVHKAHQRLLNLTAKIADEKKLISAAFVFETHPLQVLGKQDFCYITQNRVKEQKIIEAGIEKVIFKETTKELLSLSPEEFVLKILRDELSAKVVVAGYNYTFGKGGRGDSEYLKKLCREQGIEVLILGKEELFGEAVSSSRIREYLASGDIEKANMLLGYPFSIRGEVKEGKKLGREIGFPTANVEFEPNMIIPKFGVYKSVVLADGGKYNAVTNIGTNPTVEKAVPRAECHILDFNKDIYGQEIEICLLHKIRDEIKFESIEKLKIQIKKDKNYVLNSLEEF